MAHAEGRGLPWFDQRRAPPAPPAPIPLTILALPDPPRRFQDECEYHDGAHDRLRERNPASAPPNPGPDAPYIPALSSPSPTSNVSSVFYRERAPDIAATFPSHAVIDPAEIDPVLKHLGPLLNSPRGGVGPPRTGAPRGGSGHNLISHSVAPAPGQLGRMPSIPADAGAFFDENDLASLTHIRNDATGKGLLAVLRHVGRLKEFKHKSTGLRCWRVM